MIYKRCTEDGHSSLQRSLSPLVALGPPWRPLQLPVVLGSLHWLPQLLVVLGSSHWLPHLLVVLGSPRQLLPLLVGLGSLPHGSSHKGCPRKLLDLLATAEMLHLAGTACVGRTAQMGENSLVAGTTSVGESVLVVGLLPVTRGRRRRGG